MGTTTGLAADQQLRRAVSGGLVVEAAPEGVHDHHETGRIAAAEAPHRRARAAAAGDLRPHLLGEAHGVAPRAVRTDVGRRAARLPERLGMPSGDHVEVGAHAAHREDRGLRGHLLLAGGDADHCAVVHEQPIHARRERRVDAVELTDPRPEHADDVGAAVRHVASGAVLAARADDVDQLDPQRLDPVDGRSRLVAEPLRHGRLDGPLVRHHVALVEALGAVVEDPTLALVARVRAHHDAGRVLTRTADALLGLDQQDPRTGFEGLDRRTMSSDARADDDHVVVVARRSFAHSSASSSGRASGAQAEERARVLRQDLPLLVVRETLELLLDLLARVRPRSVVVGEVVAPQDVPDPDDVAIRDPTGVPEERARRRARSSRRSACAAGRRRAAGAPRRGDPSRARGGPASRPRPRH